MAERRARRTKKEILTSKLDKAKQDREKYKAKVSELDKTIKNLEEQLNAQRQDEVMDAIAEAGLSIDEAISRIKE